MKKLLAIVLTLSLVLGSFGFVFADEDAAAYADVDGAACQEAVEALAGYGVVSGYPDGTYKPANIVTRAELAKLIITALGKADCCPAADSTFSDTAGHWAERYITFAAKMGIIDGYPDGTFKPQNTVTYNEAVTMIVRALRYTELEGTWPANFMEKGAELGVTEGITGTSAGANRGDIAILLYQAIDVPYNETTMTMRGKLDSLLGEEVLFPFVLTAFYGDKVNFIEMDADPLAMVWDPVEGHWWIDDEVTTEDTVVGNYVRIVDNDGNGKGNFFQVIEFADAPKYWNAEMRWLNGVGENTEPSVDDATGVAAFSPKNKIPLGERLLTGFGLGDYSGTTDFSNLDEITYWPLYDYYNVESNDTLTMLTNYRSSLQSTGWACGTTSALTVFDWFGLRGDMNDQDTAGLRGVTQESWNEGTLLKAQIDIFKNAAAVGITGEWKIVSSYDDPYLLRDSQWVQDTLAAGIPIMIGWDSFGGHWQVIIGYDNMGTEGVGDDVLILMDPYDTTDQRNDGYNIQSYERMIWGTQSFQEDCDPGIPIFVAANPVDWKYTPVKTGYTIPSTDPTNNAGVYDDPAGTKIDYRDTGAKFKEFYLTKKNDTEDNAWAYYSDETGLSGPACADYYRANDYKLSPYYKTFDFYSMESTDTLKMLTKYKSSQQASEFTCGVTASLGVVEWFGMNEPGLTEMDLSVMRSRDIMGATLNQGVTEIFTTLNKDYGQDWVWFTQDDLSDPYTEESYIGDYCLQAGTDPDWPGLIPYLLEKGIPMIIGSVEWGGHWQTIIGYDDMGTPGATQDDVLILMESYDTSDHNMDGYYLEPFERLVYGWYVNFEPAEDFDHNNFVVAFPASKYPEVIKELGL